MKVGDTVRFLNDVGGGVVARIEGKTAYVVDADGFETPALVTQCVVVPGAETGRDALLRVHDESETRQKVTTVNADAQKRVPTGQPVPTSNYLALLFEPQDIKRLSQTQFDLYLMNDTDYRLLYAVSTRDRLDSGWTLLAAGEAEPASQEFLAELLPTELNRFENIAVHIIKFKPDGEFELQEPLGLQMRFDVTRLAKLHCFIRTDYSSTPVLTLPLKKFEIAERPVTPKTAVENRRPITKSTKDGPKVIDLHIHELLDSTAGMEPADILAYQLDVFDREMKLAAKQPGTKVIFIHGKGEGVLRRALLDRLRRYWPKSEAQDASFLEYGFGATQITVR